jgi:hypothetical protein
VKHHTPPFTTPGPIQGSFSAVSCQSATECVAVGQATLPGGTGNTGPFVANLAEATISAENGVAPAASQILKLRIKS